MDVQDRAPADRWYVVAVEPQAEAKVVERAASLKIEAYYPTGKHYVRARQRRIVVMEPRSTPAMPGYVFVQGDRHFSNFRRDFDAPAAVAHCVGWLTDGDGPVAVRPAEIEEMRRRAAAGDYDTLEAQGRYLAPRWLRPKARVRIMAGPLLGRVGEVWRMTAARRVSLWVSMLNGLRLVETDVENVARAR